MATQHGINNLIIPQPDFSAIQSQDLSWDATQSFICRIGQITEAWMQANFYQGRPIHHLDPNYEHYFNFLLLSTTDISNLEGGLKKITCKFVGKKLEAFFETPTGAEIDAEDSVADDEDTSDATSGSSATYDPALVTPVTSATYSLRSVIDEQPLAHHWKWKELSSGDQYKLSLLLADHKLDYETDKVGVFTEGGTWEYATVNKVAAALTGDALLFAKLITQGVTSFKSPSFEWSRRWSGQVGMTAAQLNSIGKITSPPGPPPTPGGNRNWMCVGANQEQAGTGKSTVFHCEVCFLLSQPGGHNSFLYTT